MSSWEITTKQKYNHTSSVYIQIQLGALEFGQGYCIMSEVSWRPVIITANQHLSL